MNPPSSISNSSLQQKALYHPFDTRTDISEIDGLGLDQEFTTVLKDQVKGVACLIHQNYLTVIIKQDAPAEYEFSPMAAELKNRTKKGVQIGENEKFANEPTPGFGTAFLISKRYALTACHCLCQENSTSLNDDLIKKTRLVFGFQNANGNQKFRFTDQNIYKIKKVAAWSFNKDVDWALLKLDLEVIDEFPPLKCNFAKKVAKKTSLYMLGHPGGLPLKYTGEGEVKALEPYLFQADLDAFGGNSGSPVFNKTTRLVIGILVRGQSDYEVDANYHNTGLSKAKTHCVTKEEIGKCGYEKVQKLSCAGFVEDYISAKNGEANAQCKIGLRYIEGEEVCKNQEEGIKWLCRAAKQKDQVAQLKLVELGKGTFYGSSYPFLVSVVIEKTFINFQRHFFQGDYDLSIDLASPVPLMLFSLNSFIQFNTPELSLTNLAKQDDRFLIFKHLQENAIEEAKKIYDNDPAFFKNCFNIDFFKELVIRLNNQECIRFFVNGGISFKGLHFQELFYALGQKADQSFKALLTIPELDLKATEQSTGNTLLHSLVQDGNSELLEAYCAEFKKRFPEYYAEFLHLKIPSSPSIGGLDALDIAIKGKNYKIAGFLIQEGLPIEEKLSAWAKSKNEVQLNLLKRIFSEEIKTTISPKIKMKLLKDCGLNQLTEKFEIAEKLITYQFLPFDKKDLRDEEGNGPILTVLQASAFTCKFKLKLVSLLLSGELPDEINQANLKGETPLMVATKKDYYLLESLLKISGVDPNQKDLLGNTALHYAVSQSGLRRTTILLEHQDTKVSLQNNLGQTPLQLSQKQSISNLFTKPISTVNYPRQTKGFLC